MASKSKLKSNDCSSSPKAAHASVVQNVKFSSSANDEFCDEREMLHVSLWKVYDICGFFVVWFVCAFGF